MAGLRTSVHTVTIELDGEYALLMNQVAGSLDRVPRDMATAVEGHYDGLDEPTLAYFEARGYLTRSSPDEEDSQLKELVSELEAARAEVQAAPLFSFVTTYACNLACSYCFQGNTGMRRSESGRMSVDLAVRCLEVVARAPRHESRAVVELFGGEPLLPSLREVVQEIVRGAEGLGYITRATTNGTSLEHFSDLLSPTALAELQVSIDGDAFAHNRRRIPLSGAPTFDKIWSNVRMALEKGVQIFVSANLDKRNVESFPRLVDFIDSEGLLGHPLLRVDYIDVKPDPVSPDQGADFELTLADIEEFLRDAQGEHPTLAAIAAPHEIGTFDNWVASNFSHQKTRHCGAVTNNVYFGPDEFIYSCHETVGRSEYAIGRLAANGIDYFPVADNWRSRRVDRLAKCRRCPYVLTCSGGCAARTNIIEEPHQEYCDGFDTKFRAMIQRQYLAQHQA